MRNRLATTPTPVEFELVSTPDLGDFSYIIFVGESAVAIDVQRDIDRLDRTIGEALILAVFETHIHNDYASGGHLLAAAHDARYVLPAGTGSRLPHDPASDGDVFGIDEVWSLRALHTPGHTPNHTSYQLDGPDGAVVVFSGGSMLVGAVGRTDLISPERTEELARDQYRSVNRLATVLPDPVVVAPTHGAGSFCSSSEVRDTTSTIELEKKRNPALTAFDEDAFVRTQISGLVLHPSYYQHMAPLNLAGAAPVTDTALPELSPDELSSIDAELIDVRPADQWAQGHIPGSLLVSLRDDAGQYLGWVLEWNRPLVLIGSEDDTTAVRLQLARIGYDSVIGVVTDDLAAWRAADRPLTTTRLADFADVREEKPEVLLDVRDPQEVRDGRLPGAIAEHVSRLPEAAESLPEGEIWVYCGSGYRASIAAGFVERSGRTPVIVFDDWEPNGRNLLGGSSGG